MAPTTTDNCEFECATVEATTTTTTSISGNFDFENSAATTGTDTDTGISGNGNGSNFEESNEVHLSGQQDHQDQDVEQQKQMPWEAPGKQGLYDPQNEHEACGVGFIVAIDGKRSHKVIITFFIRDLKFINKWVSFCG